MRMHDKPTVEVEMSIAALCAVKARHRNVENTIRDTGI